MIDLGLGWLWAIGAGIIALAATWLGGRKSAKTDAKIKGLEDENEARKTRNEVDNRIATERDARERLRDKWQR